MTNRLYGIVKEELMKEAGLSGYYITPPGSTDDDGYYYPGIRSTIESALGNENWHGAQDVRVDEANEVYARPGLHNGNDTAAILSGIGAVGSGVVGLSGLAHALSGSTALNTRLAVGGGFAVGGGLGAVLLGILAANRAAAAQKNREYGEEESMTDNLLESGYSGLGKNRL